MRFWSFLVKFAAWSLGLFVLWHAFLAAWYVSFVSQLGLLATASAGYTAQIKGSGRAAQVVFIYATGKQAIQLEVLTVGLLPFLALVGATGTRSAVNRLRMGGLGAGIFVLFHAVLFVAYPFFLSRHGLIVDSLGAFCAILGLVGFPFLLWILLLRIDGEATAARPAPGET